MKWQQSLDRLPFRLVDGDGFTIKLFAHSSFVRYTEGNRDLTLVWKKDLNEANGQKRRFWLFSGYSRVVCVPSNLIWDDGTPMQRDDSSTALQRICEAVQGRWGKCSVAIDDRLYQEMQRDVDAAGNPFRTRKTDSK
jgi:hypothetical protein